MKESKAVALRYHEGLPAPMVIAKAKNLLAERLIEIAKEYAVPVEEMPELSEALFDIEIGDFIPEEFYSLVAELLVFVRAVRMRQDLKVEA